MPPSNDALTLEIELLTGAYRAVTPSGDAEWPPHPDRIFSALVQSWADGDRRDDEAEALRWLEGLPAPLIDAEGRESVAIRTMPTTYVPPNDPTDVTILPDLRKRQGRTFAAVVPTSPTVTLQWRTENYEKYVLVLNALALRVASLGHSSSLARFRFSVEPLHSSVWTPSTDRIGTRLRVTYSGRLSDLVRAWERGKHPSPGPAQAYRMAMTPHAQTASPFSDQYRWIVYRTSDKAEYVPLLTDFAHVTSALRAPFRRAEQRLRETVLGLDASDHPVKVPHLAIIPLANIGWKYSDGSLKGFAFVFPLKMDDQSIDDVLQALVTSMSPSGSNGASARIEFSGRTWYVEPDPAGVLASLRLSRYFETAAQWTTATPAFFDRVPKGPRMIGDLVASACEYAGLPTPIEIRASQYSPLRGAVAASANSPAERWSFPSSSPLRNRMAAHLTLRFAEPVAGPLLIGAGRYSGFGLCLPIPEEI